ncbi:hypothetical protein [Mycobacterium leprae]|uniref:hypothetical protein n=1 Tax=Mycobacterium leprae TaxID=1769 RepID=UPI000A410463|nr:hypothetical protein [Mycobacterium leprae]
MNYLEARPPTFIAWVIEMASFCRILYPSYGFGPAELYFLGTALWRTGMHHLLRVFA